MDGEYIFDKMNKYYEEHPEVLEMLRKFNIEKKNYYMSLQNIQQQGNITFSSASNRTY